MVEIANLFIMKITTIKRGGRNDEELVVTGLTVCFWIVAYEKLTLCS